MKHTEVLTRGMEAAERRRGWGLGPRAPRGGKEGVSLRREDAPQCTTPWGTAGREAPRWGGEEKSCGMDAAKQ